MMERKKKAKEPARGPRMIRKSFTHNLQKFQRLKPISLPGTDVSSNCVNKHSNYMSVISWFIEYAKTAIV
jgi:hypothetical protein